MRVRLVHAGHYIVVVGEGESACAGGIPLTGTDIYSGVLQAGWGSEGREYTGEVDRTYAFPVCGVKPLRTFWDELTYCGVTVNGSGRARLSIAVRDDRETPVWITVYPIQGAGSTSVTGDCIGASSDPMSDGMTMSDMKNENTPRKPCVIWVACPLGFAATLPPSAFAANGIAAGMYTFAGNAYPVAVGTWTFEFGKVSLKAVIAVQQPVGRGEVATFDGSASTGRITAYTWTLTPEGCPPGSERGRAGTRTGATVTATLLCPVRAALEVSDGSAVDRGSVSVGITPRRAPFKTTFQMATEGTLPNSKPPTNKRDTKDNMWVGLRAFLGGESVCALDDPETPEHFFHPREEKGTWGAAGYVLAQVTDQGPFAGMWYVTDYKLTIARKTLINKFLREDGPPPPRHTQNIVTANRTRNFAAPYSGRPADIDGYVAAIRAHEGLQNPKGVLGHAGLVKKALSRLDPAPEIETMSAQSRDALRQAVDAKIRTAEFGLCEASKDPLPRIWTGKIGRPRDDVGIYVLMTASLGGTGAGYENMATCAQ